MSSIWLTRPLHQATALVEALMQQGDSVLHIPMLEIEALPWDAAVKARILDYDHYDLAFFISSNAATLGMECVNNYWPQYPTHIKNFALGPSSAAVLQSHDLLVSYPQQAMSTEAVLALPELSQLELSGRKVLIFRGIGGRETLAEGLRERGAKVDYVELYRRNLPNYSHAYLKECIQTSAPDGVVISSAEALENFTSLLNEDLWPQLFQVPLLVSSQRIAKQAEGLGFKEIIIMPGANDESIMQALTHRFS